MRWLADHGLPFTATVLNLVARFSAVLSAASYGVCEAFVKTLKRDCAAVNPRPDANSVLQRLGHWFEDDNTFRPQSG